MAGDKLIELLRGLGVPEEHLHVLEPLPAKHRQNVELIAREVNHRGLSVVVAQRACIQTKRKAPVAQQAAEPAVTGAN